jgi:hypothetical protein
MEDVSEGITRRDSEAQSSLSRSSAVVEPGSETKAWLAISQSLRPGCSAQLYDSLSPHSPKTAREPLHHSLIMSHISSRSHEQFDHADRIGDADKFRSDSVGWSAIVVIAESDAHSSGLKSEFLIGSCFACPATH